MANEIIGGLIIPPAKLMSDAIGRDIHIDIIKEAKTAQGTKVRLVKTKLRYILYYRRLGDRVWQFSRSYVLGQREKALRDFEAETNKWGLLDGNSKDAMVDTL